MWVTRLPALMVAFAFAPLFGTGTPMTASGPAASGSTLAEGVTIDADGNLYGADFLGTVRKFVKK
jgi:hypothetical protein